MAKRDRELLATILGLLDEAGATYTVDHKRRHTQVRFEYMGHKLLYTVPISTGDYRATLNCVAHIRRMLRRIRTEAGQ